MANGKMDGAQTYKESEESPIAIQCEALVGVQGASPLSWEILMFKYLLVVMTCIFYSILLCSVIFLHPVAPLSFGITPPTVSAPRPNCA